MAKSSKVVAGIIGAGVVGAVVLFGRQIKAGARRFGKGVGKNVQISKNFSTSEFLQSEVAPDLINWTIPPSHFANIQALVNDVLQPARDKFGPLKITSGYRPKSYRNAKGETFFDLLRQAGYKPSKDSDHYYGQAAGIFPLRIENMIPLWVWLKNHPKVRQVIMYFKTKPSGGVRLQHIHVAVATKDRPRIEGRNHWFYMLDGKRTEELPMAV